MAKERKGRQGNVWIVQGGDNVAKIARDVYGNERMMAEIMRLNGGVKTLRPGMVLKLPNQKKNEDIFISNDWAANMGMATTGQVADWYKNPDNKGGMTSAWNQAGGGWKNSVAGGGPGLSAMPTMQNGNIVQAQASADPYGNNVNAIAQARANAGRGTNASRGNAFSPNIAPASMAAAPRNPTQNDVWNAFNNISPQQNKPLPQSPNANVYGNNPNFITDPLAQAMRSRGTFSNYPQPQQPQVTQQPGSTTPYWQKPADTTTLKNIFGAAKNTFVGNTTPPPPGSTIAGTAGNTTAPKQAINPYQAFGISNQQFAITPTEANQNPDTLQKIAPFVQQAISSYAYSVKAPPGQGTFTLAQAKLLEQAGLITPGTDNYNEIYGYLNQNSAGTQPKAPVTDTTPTGNGSWDVWNLGGTNAPTWMSSQNKRGGGKLANYSGYIRNSYGPSLGLFNWRGI